MKKVILLSAVLGLGALGMACGETPANNANTKPSTPASTPMAVATTPMNTMTPGNTTSTGNTMKPGNTTSPMKSSNSTAPVTSPTKK